MATVLDWQPVLVLSMTELSEMHAAGSSSLGEMLKSAGVEWGHLPVRDYGGLSGETAKAWPNLSSALHGHLDNGKGVLVHCHGGQDRSGMIALRLMVDRGEDPGAALRRLRAARPGAVETDEQHAWALRSRSSTA
ncbi:MAG: protein phosphatase [Alphaproteobacteria bacterium]|nr:protein phosphatase [Alphaproteobacteria bacterium]